MHNYRLYASSITVLTASLALLFYGAITPSALLMSNGSTQQQSRIKQVKVSRSEPVELSQLRVKGQAVDFGQGFQLDENWVDGVEVDVKNVTTKAIVKLRISLYVPVNDTVKHSADFGFKYAKRIAPGATVKVSTDKEVNDKIKAKLAAGGKSIRYDDAEVRVDSLTFEDGTIWAQGTLYRPDPDDPSKFVEVKEAAKVIDRRGGPVSFKTVSFKIDDTFPSCGKRQVIAYTSCFNFPEHCNTMIFTIHPMQSGNYSPRRVTLSCDGPSWCGADEYDKAESCWILGE
jgi:hypothetical protein